MIKKFDEFIKESYNSLGLIKSRSNYYMINESQESKSQSEAIKLVMNTWGWNYEKADKFIRIDLRNDITPLRDKQIGKFTLGITRMYLNNEITDANTISDINATLKLLTAHLNEYNRNLNGLSAEELISKFKQARENNVKQEKQEINRIKFGTSDYDIIRIDSFNDAKKYYKYTNPSSRWCLTHMNNMYDRYTCDGISQIYFCLRHGFEDIKQIKGETTPLDEYGLSMLSIIVNEEGELAYCTTRWNHENGGDDSAMDAVEISKVVNVNFYETFKPNTKWKDMVDSVKRRLANGESPKRIFDSVDNFSEGYARVELNDKYNLINKNGEIISDKWFDTIYDFKYGYAQVLLNHKWNFINTDCEYLSDKWFDSVDNFSEGYAIVKLNKKYNFINKNGEIISDTWFDDAYGFSEGYACVKLNDKWNFINKNFEYLSDKWFGFVNNFKDGYAKVKLNGKYNFINKKCEIISDTWFDDVYGFSEGYAQVLLNKKWNLINTDGEILSDKWFDLVYHFIEGYAQVDLNGKYNFINTDGEILSDTWFNEVYGFIEGYSVVKLNKKYNFINTDGEILSDTWFDNLYDFKEGYAQVELNDKWNFINKNGEIMLDKWLNTYKETKDALNNLLKK